MAEAEVVVLFNLFPELPKLIQHAIEKAVKKAAFDIAAHAAREHAFKRRSGFLESSIYVSIHPDAGDNLYPYSKAASQTPPTGAELLPEVEKPASKTVAHVAVGANYGMYVEFGTVNMSAYPYLLPAAELVYPQFIVALSELEASLEL